jgi:hypothetical protein
MFISGEERKKGRRGVLKQVSFPSSNPPSQKKILKRIIFRILLYRGGGVPDAASVAWPFQTSVLVWVGHALTPSASGCLGLLCWGCAVAHPSPKASNQAKVKYLSGEFPELKGIMTWLRGVKRERGKWEKGGRISGTLLRTHRISATLGLLEKFCLFIDLPELPVLVFF